MTTLAGRRTTFDFEPLHSTDGVNDVLIQGGDYAAQRFGFISATGSEPVTNITLRDVLFTSGWIGVTTGPRSAGWDLENVVSRNGYGSGSGAAWPFHRVDGVRVVGCTQRLQPGRDMAMVVTKDCTDVEVHGNTAVGGIEYRDLG